MIQSIIPRVIVLTGPMGAGKSAVGAALAAQHGGVLFDSDHEIESRAGHSIAEIFATEGEDVFRTLERDFCVSCIANATPGTVLALGGGAFMNEDIRRAASGPDVLSVYLHTSPKSSWARIQNTRRGKEQRPLLAHPDPLARLDALYEQRHPTYKMATLTIYTDALSADEVAQAIMDQIERNHDVVNGARLGNIVDGRNSARDTSAGDNAAGDNVSVGNVSSKNSSNGRTHKQKTSSQKQRVQNAHPDADSSSLPMEHTMIEVRTTHARYPVVFVDTAEEVAKAIIDAAPNGRLLLVSDDNVAPHYLAPLQTALEAHKRQVRTFVVPAGETSKSIERATQLWNEIFDGDVDRQDIVIALGGGVVGDLAGFIASTTMRGLSFIQVPTTMLAMSDAAIGGKTGINVSAGKNLVGAFHQPLAVVAWIATLVTLSRRELVSGLAEVIKSAMIDSPEAVEEFRTIAARAVEGDTQAIRDCARIGAGLKARIVSEDEKERGVRSLLNYGHTFAHAIEHASGYGEWTHGEAVGAGMVVATEYARDVGHASDELVETIRTLVRSVGLPDTPPKMALSEWTEPIFRDKKRSGDSVRLILPRAAGDLFGEITHFDTLSQWIQKNLVE